ncbi:MAG: Niacin transporter NiaP, partial [uncultured Thermomicrobiales bacterium]
GPLPAPRPPAPRPLPPAARRLQRARLGVRRDGCRPDLLRDRGDRPGVGAVAERARAGRLDRLRGDVHRRAPLGDLRRPLRAQADLPADPARLFDRHRAQRARLGARLAARPPLPGRPRGRGRVAGRLDPRERDVPRPAPGSADRHPGEFLGLRLDPGGDSRLLHRPARGVRLALGLLPRRAPRPLRLRPPPRRPRVAPLARQRRAARRGGGDPGGDRARERHRTRGDARGRPPRTGPNPAAAVRPALRCALVVGLPAAHGHALDPLVRDRLLLLRSLHLAPLAADRARLQPQRRVRQRADHHPGAGAGLLQRGLAGRALGSQADPRHLPPRLGRRRLAPRQRRRWRGSGHHAQHDRRARPRLGHADGGRPLLRVAPLLLQPRRVGRRLHLHAGAVPHHPARHRRGRGGGLRAARRDHRAIPGPLAPRRATDPDRHLRHVHARLPRRRGRRGPARRRDARQSPGATRRRRADHRTPPARPRPRRAARL